MGENFALRWNDFHSNLESLFKHLRSATEHQDVTLVCGREAAEVRAHKVILASFSGYLQTVLSRTSAQHPVIVMPQDVHLDDINGIVDFMYHGEVAVPTQDLSRFLTVAEQFQVRGLVEDVPKLGAVPVSSSRYQSKRPRLLQEEDEPSVETVDQEDGGLVPGSGGAEGGYQPPYDSSMVGLVCPRCSVICRGVAELQSHMATQHGGQQQRPVQQVAPAMRAARPGPGPSKQQPLKQRSIQPKPQPQGPGRGGGHHQTVGRHPVRHRGPGGGQPQPPGRQQPPAQPRPGPGPGAARRQGQGQGARGGQHPHKPDLREIGQKLGLAVSITRSADQPAAAAPAASHKAAAAAAEPEPAAADPGPGIKEEPAECAEDVAEAPDTAEEAEYAEEFLPEEEGDGYENQFDDGYDLNLGEDYVGTHDNYPGYDDYDDGGDGEDATSKK